MIKLSECMVLICSYYVNSVDTNLQELCRNVHLFDILISEAMPKAMTHAMADNESRTTSGTVLNSENIRICGSRHIKCPDLSI